MAFLLRESKEGTQHSVEVSYRHDGFVYFKHFGDTSDKLDRLTEADFDARYVDESTLRLEEGG